MRFSQNATSSKVVTWSGITKQWYARSKRFKCYCVQRRYSSATWQLQKRNFRFFGPNSRFSQSWSHYSMSISYQLKTVSNPLLTSYLEISMCWSSYPLSASLLLISTCILRTNLYFNLFLHPTGAPDKSKCSLLEPCYKEKIVFFLFCLWFVIATITFGMGINCSNVRKIIHNSAPEDLDTYIQETGRAGWDGQHASALTICQKRRAYNYEWYHGRLHKVEGSVL